MRYQKFCITLLCLLFLSFKILKAQSDDVSFLIKEIKNNYAGYPAVDKKKFDRFLIKTFQKSERDTFKMLATICSYFKDPHLQVYELNSIANIDTSADRLRQSLLSTNEYLKSTKVGNYEGYWLNDYHSNIIAVIRDNNGYKALLVESRSKKVPVGTVIAEFHPISEDKFTTKYLAPATGHSFFLTTVFRNDSIMVTGDASKWRKVKNYNPGDSLLIKLTPFLGKNSGTQLDQYNYLLTLPDFGGPNTAFIDSLIKAESPKIKTSKNLIIDIRGNGGGRTLSYLPIVPYIYTNPISTSSGMTYSSPGLIEQNKSILQHYKKNKKDEVEKIKFLEDKIQKLEKAKGTFIDQKGETMKYDSIMPMPKNVAIITDYACQSASEMMVLEFKQSKKVTVFGENTFGAVDFLDAYTTELPSKKYIMLIATVKRKIPKGQNPTGGIGIKPDIIISDTISNWVEFVKSYYKQNSRP
jgi:hypothetical protein